jgi:ribosomal protein S9
MSFNEYVIICKKKSATVRLVLQTCNNKFIPAIKIPSTISESDINLLKKLQESFRINFFFKGGGINTRLLLLSAAIEKAYNSYIIHKETERLFPMSIKIYDTRKKERKKFGLKKARKAPQFSKR